MILMNIIYYHMNGFAPRALLSQNDRKYSRMRAVCISASKAGKKKKKKKSCTALLETRVRSAIWTIFLHVTNLNFDVEQYSDNKQH